MFKIIVVLFVISSLAVINCVPIKTMKIIFSPEVGAEINRGVAACKADSDDISSFLDMIHTGQYTEHEHFKTFIECLVKTNGFTDSKGRFLVDKVISLYPDKEIMTEVVNKCNKETADITVAVTFETFKCFQRENPYEIYF